MTDLDKPAFAQAMARLCVALREKQPDAVQLRVYYEALKDLEVEFLAAAAEQLGQGAEWFPKTSEWRAAAAKIERDRTDQQRAILRNLPEPLCLACRDTGWAHNETTNQVSRCDCTTLRRLEILGRRPMPRAELPPMNRAQLSEVEAKVAIAVKGMP